MNGRFRKGVGAGVVVVGAGAVSWLSARLRRAAALVGAGAAAGVVSWQSAPVLVSAGCACRMLAVPAACILPASRMSRGRWILPSYLIWVYACVNLYRVAQFVHTFC